MPKTSEKIHRTAEHCLERNPLLSFNQAYTASIATVTATQIDLLEKRMNKLEKLLGEVVDLLVEKEETKQCCG